MIKILKSYLPPHVKQALKKAQYFGATFYCPLCRSRLRRLLPFGLASRPNAQCPVCGSLERHRLMWMFLTQKTNLFAHDNKKMLHIAPDWGLEPKLKQVPGLNYVTADLQQPGVVERMDITRIPHPNDTFDVIICSHVLEHVPDDQAAMREFYRVLAPTGWAILQVPITADHTIEDPSVTSPEERERIFGQYDHVRVYGPDYLDQLRDAGFKVSRFAPDSFLDKAQIRSMGIIEGSKLRFPYEEIFLCEK